MEMDLDYDPGKNARNLQRRGLSFELVKQFEWLTACIEEDTRERYGERRWQATGFLNGVLSVVVFTNRNGKVRVISLRKASKHEAKRYVQQTRP